MIEESRNSEPDCNCGSTRTSLVHYIRHGGVGVAARCQCGTMKIKPKITRWRPACQQVHVAELSSAAYNRALLN